MCFFKILDDGQSPKKGDCVSYFIGAVFSCLCAYDSLTMQAAVFGSAWSGSQQFGSAVHMRISDYLTYLSTGFKEKTSSFIQLNMVCKIQLIGGSTGCST
jgi:hypothetical protein